jgi:DNA invertase Pin-like site-specific DNA recombinase
LVDQRDQWVTFVVRICPLPKRLVGYARVSTYGQTLDAQLEQLRAAGGGSRHIYREKVTGARADRRELLRMLDRLAAGDVVTVTRIDRLARSTFDLFGIVKRIVHAKAQFRSLAEPWADTGTSTGRLLLAVLGGLADVERDLIRTRTAEGGSRAKAQGKHIGRPPALTPEQQKVAAHRRARGATLQKIRAQLRRRDIDHPAGDASSLKQTGCGYRRGVPIAVGRRRIGACTLAACSLSCVRVRASAAAGTFFSADKIARPNLG